MMPHRTIFNWSGGKDTALALYHILQQPQQWQDGSLLTSVNQGYYRVSMHGVRLQLMQQQANAMALPLVPLFLPEQPDIATYNQLMGHTMQQFKAQGYTHAVFGDIFLEDLRRYREEKLAAAGFQTYFPLWQCNTTRLVHEFIDLGFQAIIVCTKAELLDSSFIGRIIDHQFVKDLPPTVDPCGENGEFHSFVFNGPIFRQPVPVTIGEKVYRTYTAPNNNEQNMGFWFCDLFPASV
jgi:uncharacterized protein (TIGR00290 family)